jgi:uncharacterized membrane protein (UPF0127 family)
MRFLVSAALLVLAALSSLSCGGPKATTLDDFPTRPVTLPSGKVLRVETATSDFELLRGMMFRTSLAPDRGMLFVYPKPDHYQFWTYQIQFPVDIIWLDSNRDIVEIFENAPPCNTKASKCPQYGGKQISAYVLEIGEGMARKYGLGLGQRIQW